MKVSKILKTEICQEIKFYPPNIPIERFYSTLDDEEIIKKLINLSNPIEKENTIFIWPEGVIPNINLKKFKNEYDYIYLKIIFKKSFN